MLFAIHAYEESYCGLHGIEKLFVIYCDSYEEAQEIALEEAMDVCYSYSSILEQYERSAVADEVERDTDEWYDYIDECVRESCLYEIYELNVKDDKTIEELNKEFYNDREEFLKEYAINRE